MVWYHSREKLGGLVGAVTEEIVWFCDPRAYIEPQFPLVLVAVSLSVSRKPSTRARTDTAVSAAYLLPPPCFLLILFQEEMAGWLAGWLTGHLCTFDDLNILLGTSLASQSVAVPFRALSARKGASIQARPPATQRARARPSSSRAAHVRSAWLGPSSRILLRISQLGVPGAIISSRRRRKALLCRAASRRPCRTKGLSPREGCQPCASLAILSVPRDCWVACRMDGWSKTASMSCLFQTLMYTSHILWYEEELTKQSSVPEQGPMGE